MLSNLVIGLLLGLGVAGWVYGKMMRTTGNNTKNALIVAAVSGIGAMVLIIILLGMLFKSA